MFNDEFFVVGIPYTDTLFIIRKVYIVIKNQYSTFHYKRSFFLKFNLFFLTLVDDGAI